MHRQRRSECLGHSRGLLDPGVDFVLVRCRVSGLRSRSIRCLRNAIGPPDVASSTRRPIDSPS